MREGSEGRRSALRFDHGGGGGEILEGRVSKARSCREATCLTYQAEFVREVATCRFSAGCTVHGSKSTGARGAWRAQSLGVCHQLRA